MDFCCINTDVLIWLITQFLIQSAIFGITPTSYGITPAGATSPVIAAGIKDDENDGILVCVHASLETLKNGH